MKAPLYIQDTMHDDDDDDDGKGQSRLRRRLWVRKLTMKWIAASVLHRVIWVVSFVVGVYASYWLYRKSRRFWQGNHPPPKQTLDFLVAGFPKCGTTSILFALHNHPDVIMDDKEYCHIARPLQQDDVNWNRLNRYLTDLKDDRLKELGESTTDTSKIKPRKLGIKCPEALKNFKSIHRLSQHSPESKWVIGLRHPVWFVQSFYNYRVHESHVGAPTPEQSTEIPTLQQLWQNSSVVFRDLTRDSARFDLFLSQLGKASLDMKQLNAFVDHGMLAVKPNRLKIFLYVMDQIEDTDSTRKRSFQSNLLNFLDLDPNRLPQDFGHANMNKATGKSGYPETIDICSSSFVDIRTLLVEQGAQAARWILDDFLASPDVQVANLQHFQESLQKWSEDPCVAG